ncbi:MAG: response regulator [Chthoniobacteraceae bacterium]
MNQTKILIVDDDPSISRMMRVVLERMGGYLVREENRAAAALETAWEFAPDLIVLDEHMDGVHGGAVEAALHAEPVLESVPVLLATDRIKPTISVRCGGETVLTRAIDPNVLLARVSALLASPQQVRLAA